MSAAKTARQTAARTVKPATMMPGTITIPTLSSIFAPAATTTRTGNCNCGCCNQQSTTVCLTFNTSFLQNLVDMFPKIKVTNTTETCDDEAEDAKGN